MLTMLLAFSGCGGKDAGLPSAYRNLNVPEALLTSKRVRMRGRELFLEHCALCHGERADGNGIRKEGLYPERPVDFTSRAWRKTTSPRRVFYIIREGVPLTAMPGWRGTLTDDDTWALVAYILSVSGASQ